MQLVSLCFAVYNNNESLDELYTRSIEAFAEHTSKYDLELIFVNDGSTDQSLSTLRNLKEKYQDQRIRIIDFSRNFGQMAAILAGWHCAKGDIVINLAADLQDPPEQSIHMLKEFEKGHEIVISYRESHATSLLNRVTSKVFYKLLLSKVPPGGFDFTLLSRRALNAVLSLQERNRFYQYDILWIGYDLKFIPYHKAKRSFGKSQYTILKRINNFMVAFINVSYLPLRLMSGLGFLFFLSGLLYCSSIIYAFYNSGTPFKGWAPIMIMLLIIGGLIMLMLGILGEYIWRIFDEIKKRPSYIIKQEL